MRILAIKLHGTWPKREGSRMRSETCCLRLRVQGRDQDAPLMCLRLCLKGHGARQVSGHGLRGLGI